MSAIATCELMLLAERCPYEVEQLTSMFAGAGPGEGVSF
jgi:hypothetical protein